MTNTFQKYAIDRLVPYGFRVTLIGNWVQVNGETVMTFGAIDEILGAYND